MDIPSGSIYFWMFTQGLKHVDLGHILAACNVHGKDVREKDVQNYWNGWYRSQLYGRRSALLFQTGTAVTNSRKFYEQDWADYKLHPYLGMPEIEQRYVPCNKDNKPMIKWSEGCLSKIDAIAFPGATYMGENVKGCKFIVFDCDGDHDAKLDMETVDFMWQFAGRTHCIKKRKVVSQYEGYEDWLDNRPASFHLTFRVDRIVPTMHFHKAHIDIVGNEKNSLRYFKDKVWNGMEPADMTPEIWNMFKSYIRRREEACDD